MTKFISLLAAFLLLLLGPSLTASTPLPATSSELVEKAEDELPATISKRVETEEQQAWRKSWNGENTVRFTRRNDSGYFDITFGYTWGEHRFAERIINDGEVTEAWLWRKTADNAGCDLEMIEVGATIEEIHANPDRFGHSRWHLDTFKEQNSRTDFNRRPGLRMWKIWCYPLKSISNERDCREALITSLTGVHPILSKPGKNYGKDCKLPLIE